MWSKISISFTKKGFSLNTNLFTLTKENGKILLAEKTEKHEKKEKRILQVNLSLVPFEMDTIALVKEGEIQAADTYDVVVFKMKSFFRNYFFKNNLQEPFGFYKETQEATLDKNFDLQEKKYILSSDKKFTCDTSNL